MRTQVIILIIILLGLALTAIGLTLAQFYNTPIENISSNFGI